MKFVAGALVALTVAGLNTVALGAECGIEGKGSVRILSNDFDALRLVNSVAAECASDAVQVSSNATTEHKNLQVPALTINPAEYSVAVVANNSIVPLLNDDLIRPLDDLVEKYGQDLQPSQLIKIDGHVMAIAFMGNGQHLVFRKDILDQVGMAAPKTYDDVLAAAEAIRAAGILQYPLAASVKPGWDLAAEFVNHYLGTGAPFFADGTAELAIDNESGREVLELMSSMTEYMDPDYLTFDALEIQKRYEAGQVAIMNEWGSVMGAILDDEGAAAGVVENTVLAAAPTIGDGSVPATALWWDGFAISKNISDEDAAVSFQAMLHGIRPEMVAENQSVATWLVEGYKPGPASVGVVANANGGAVAYPMQPYMGLLHNALSTELAEFIAGSEDAKQALADVKAAYDTAATEAGLLQ